MFIKRWKNFSSYSRGEIFEKKMIVIFQKRYFILFKNYKISLNDINYIVFYEKPFLKFERLIETYVKNSPKGFKSFVKSIPFWVKEKLYQKIILDNLVEIDESFKKKL